VFAVQLWGYICIVVLLLSASVVLGQSVEIEAKGKSRNLSQTPQGLLPRLKVWS
jgi:hypothetical protein